MDSTLPSSTARLEILHLLAARWRAALLAALTSRLYTLLVEANASAVRVAIIGRLWLLHAR